MGINAGAAAILTGTGPRHDKVAVRADGDRRISLVVGRSRVDAEFTALREDQQPEQATVTLRVDTATAAVLSGARPGDDEFAGGLAHGDG